MQKKGIKQLAEKLKEQKKRIQELTLMYEISKKVASLAKLDEILETILSKVTSVLNCEIGSILFFDKKNKILTIQAAKGLTEEVVKNTRIKLGQRISGWVASNGKAVLVKNVEKDPRFKMRSSEKYYTKSLISVPVEIKNEIIGVINVNNKRTKEVFTADDLALLKAVASETAIAIENARLYENLQNLYMRTVKALAVAIEAKDHYTHKHSNNVTGYAKAIGEKMCLSKKEIQDLGEACQLHDVGKIGIHDYVLTKTDKLNLWEWEEIKSHSLKSAQILEPLVFLGKTIEVIKQHHERYDGDGYPNGIKGENIFLGARIMAVADSYDAMVSERPYRDALTKEQAIEELKKNSGTQFDPKIVKIFLQILQKK